MLIHVMAWSFLNITSTEKFTDYVYLAESFNT